MNETEGKEKGKEKQARKQTNSKKKRGLCQKLLYEDEGRKVPGHLA